MLSLVGPVYLDWSIADAQKIFFWGHYEGGVRLKFIFWGRLPI